MNNKTVVSFRIDNEQIELLMALADLDNITLANEIRQAIEYYISSLMEDKKIKSKIIALTTKRKKERDSRLRKLLRPQ